MIVFSILMSFALFSADSKADNVERTVADMCAALDKSFQKRSWGKNPCGQVEWQVWGNSVKGRPLIYAIFGNKESKNTTLFLSMVHGDEITPLYLGFELVNWVQANLDKFKDARLVIAPLVNPDGFLDFPKTRVNANGVDPNRNFSTKDWSREALNAWRTKFRSDKRRFPGSKPDSEPETHFQKFLVETMKPRKILSVHAPLNFMDYDGPEHLTLDRFPKEYVQKCTELKNKVNATPGGFFPGSLGNYAGQGLGIPTLTLELPTADARKAKEYWRKFQKGIETVVTFEVPQKE